MGCFGGSQPTYNPPAPVKVPSAQELYGQAQDFGKTNMPMAMGAREGALTDLQNPTAYYSGFQPTSFEQALGDQSFKNIWPDQQAYMTNVLSKSGMAYSPTAATTLGNAYGNLATNIGQYLNTQANTRANQSLTSRLGIDPMSSILTPFATVGANQANTNVSNENSYNQAMAQQQYQQAMNQYQQQQSMGAVLGQLGGGAAGFLVGGPGGAMIGSNLGGMAMGGGGSLGNALQSGQGMSFNSPLSGLFKNSGSAMSVFGGGASPYSMPSSAFMNGPLTFAAA